MSSVPEVDFGALPHVDGSVRYAWQGFEVLGAVNGPIESQRRDELPEEAFLEVTVRPANGVGGTRERHIEQLIHSVLRSIILTHVYPRTLIQVTLQILKTPEAHSTSSIVPQWTSHLLLLPHLLHTALLSLLNGNISLAKTFTCALIGVDDAGKATPWPTVNEGRSLPSMHAIAISSKSETLLIESEGEFDWEDFDAAALVAEGICVGSHDGQAMDVEQVKPLHAWLRHVVEAEIAAANHWKLNL